MNIFSVATMVMAVAFNTASAFAPSGVSSMVSIRRTTVPCNDPFTSIFTESNGLQMSQENEPVQQSSIPVFLDPGTKGEFHVCLDKNNILEFTHACRT